MCNTIQYVDRVENELLVFENDSGYINWGMLWKRRNFL
jgi:hypothetical protein